MRYRLWNTATVLCFSATLTTFAQDSDPFADAAAASAPAAPPVAPVPPVLVNDPFIKDGNPVGKRVRSGESGDNVSLFVEFIEVDPLAFTELISDASLALSDGDAVRGAVSELVDSDKATVLDSCLLTSMEGKAKLQSAGELIYPAEWDPGESSQGNGEDRRDVTAKVIDGKAYLPPIAQPHPTTFEMRPVGLLLQSSFQTSLGEDMIQAKLSPELTRYIGAVDFMKGDLLDEPASSIWVPVFGTSRVTVDLSLENQRTNFLGSPRGDDDLPVLTFVRAIRQQRMPQPPLVGPFPKATVVVEYLEVTAEWFDSRMHSGEPLSARKLRDEVQDQLTKETARVVGLTSVGGQIGEELVVSGGEERIYPTEYDNADVPIETSSETPLWSPGGYPLPTALQIRNLGLSVRARVSESTLANGFEISASPYLLDDGGDRAMNELVTPEGKVPLCTMPLFLGMSIETNVFAHPGEIVLLGAMSPRGAELEAISDKRVLVFLRLAK